MTGETDKPDTPNPADDPTVQSGMHGDGHGVGQDDPTIQSEAGTGAGTAGTVRMFSKADAPKEIGPYKIIQVLGEGGFGIVYLAEQTKPVRRKVALKVIKPGMDTASVIARFESERQALAIMDHPGVAKVFNAGTTDQGLPYFVMEYIKGVPITVHCDRHKLDIRGRVGLMMQVCEAVLHAHQKGIIHRDLKPNNILVEYNDSRALVKVIDFGIAKSLNQPLTEKTLFTREGQMIGTPEYMSPEQAEMTIQDIDTRSDIYSIGVILYQVLTGSLPFEAETLRSAGFAEIARIIREEDPPKPSTKYQTKSEDATDRSRTAAEQRMTDERSLTRLLRGDLDWIVMKCLEKERIRRYDSAGSLLADLQHYLDDEPVEAGPPSIAYKASKFARRHRGALVAASLILLVIIAGSIISTMFGISEARQRRIAETERDAKSALLDVELAHSAGLSKLVDVLVQRVDSLEETAGLARLQVEHLDRVRASTPDEDLEVLQQLAKAYLELARNEWTARNPSFRDWKASEAALAESEQLLAVLNAAGASRAQVLYLQASIDTHRGDHARHELKDQDGAHAFYLSSLEGMEEAVKGDPGNEDFLFMMGMTFANLGSVEAKRGDHEAALEQYERYRETFAGLVSADSSNPLYQRNLAVALGRCGNSSGKLGDAAAERELLQESLDVRRRLVERFPEQNRQLRDVALAHYFLASRLHKDGDTTEALQHIREHLGLMEQLAWLNPLDARASGSDLRFAHGNIWLIPEYGGTRSEQLEFYERFHERLLSPQADYQSGSAPGLGLLLENLGARSTLLLDLGRVEEARSVCEEGLGLCENGLDTEVEQSNCSYLREFHDSHFSSAGG
ncbi:MAG: hypothetical protein CMJ36_02710 [Phycisphaerae bacterium]|nr:hypothetical protein [Phycisphaerae bacterium]